VSHPFSVHNLCLKKKEGNLQQKKENDGHFSYQLVKQKGHSENIVLQLGARLPGFIPAKIPYHRSSVINDVALSTAPR